MTSLLINGVSQSNFILSTPYKDTLDEELDQFNFQVKSTTRQTFKKNDKVVYIVKHTQYYTRLQKVLCLFSCVESWEGGYWLYQLTCISPTKLLENIIINGMAETYPVNNGLYGQMVRVRAKINKQLDLEGTGITLSFDNTIASSGDNSIVKDITSVSDFLWDNQVNAREIFNDMLDKADALIVATDFTVDANDNEKIRTITLSGVKRNPFDLSKRILFTDKTIENGGLEDVSEVVKGITYNRNSEFACGNIISLVKNAVAKDNVQQALMPARNTDLTIDDASKWHIITQEPIYSLNKVVALKPVAMNTIYYYDNNLELASVSYNDGAPIEYMYIPVDITNHIVEKSVFDNMSLADQAKHLYFKRGEKGIFGLYDRYKSGITGYTSIEALYNIFISNDIINEAVVENDVWSWRNCADIPFFINTSSDYTLVNHASTTLRFPFTVSRDGQKHASNIRSYTASATSDLNALKQCLFTINYQPYCDSVVKIEKTNLEESRSKNLSVLKNQSDRTIDATKYYDSQEALIKRMGNKEMVIDAIVDFTKDYSYKTTLWDLGAYMQLPDGDWKITQREFVNYGDNKLKVKYTFSKDFNASNVDIQINRDKRLYGIPLSNFVDRYIILKTDDADDIDKLGFQCWDDFTGSTTTMGYDIMEMIKIGNANITDKVARAMDNYAVDIERTKYNSTVVNIYLRYCDTDGYKDNLILIGMTNDYYNSLTISDYSRLPFLPSANIGNLGNGSFTFLINDIYKDKMERLIFIIKN